MSRSSAFDRLQQFVNSPFFNRVVIFMILFSAVLLGLETNTALMEKIGQELKFIDRFLISFFVLEILLKILSKGRKPLEYFKDPWNVVDFLIVVACLIPTGSNAMAIFRLVRVLRILRLVTALPKLQTIVGALLKSIPSMSYVVAILGIHFYMFGVLGTFLFSENDPVHFGSLGRSFLSLFQILTLEGWVDIMRIQAYGCANFGYENFQSQCIKSSEQPISAVLFFISFIVMGTMIILNLLIGVVVNGMAESHKEVGDTLITPTVDFESLTAEIRLLREEIRSLKQFPR